MKKLFFMLLAVTVVLSSCERFAGTPEPSAIAADVPASFKVFDAILFYDGYAAPVSEPGPTGVTRVSNSKYIKKLSTEQLNSAGNSMDLKVTIRAACDNYDRIGYVGIALVKKDSVYSETGGRHLEIGRFITPFMDKNKQPDQVPYLFSIDNVSSIFKDAAIRATYDIYVEFMVFGVPYAANTQIAGCAGRNDTFYGTVEFTGKSAGTAVTDSVYLAPLYFHKYFNNYDNTDVAGKTVKTTTFNVPKALKTAKLYLITSNHGANSGGEEYVRRDHFIYFDGVQKLSYKPGGKSCEPYRTYNTQGNGIYGPAPKSASNWSSWSNWCPGDVIPIRVIDLGALAAGNHTFKIEVPDAVFKDKQGYIPLSVYLQGTK